MSSKSSGEIVIAGIAGGEALRGIAKVGPETTIREAINKSGVFTVLPVNFLPGRFSVYISSGRGSFAPTDADFLVENHKIILVIENTFIATS